jgi:hypothetical protein
MVVVQAFKNERDTHTHTHTHRKRRGWREKGIIGAEKYDSNFSHGQNLVTSNYGRFEV